MPASQSGLPKDTPMTQLVKTKVRLKITELGRRRVVGSIRAVLQKERREAEAVWNEIEVGDTYHGVVKSLTSYGAFVDIGGIDGGDLSEVGQRARTSLPESLGFDREARRISLGYKRPEDNPWNKFVSTCRWATSSRSRLSS